jgi:hypothetical protein
MINFSIEISDINPTLVVLERMESGITNVFKKTLITEMGNMRDTAKRVLEEESEARTGQKYWTGLLQSAIEAEIIENRAGLFKGTVGVNESVMLMSIKGNRNVADYAVPVEVGHEMGFGGHWEGYHYMEKAYLLSRDPMIRRIESELSKTIETQWGWRNIATGRFAKAPVNARIT